MANGNILHWINTPPLTYFGMPNWGNNISLMLGVPIQTVSKNLLFKKMQDDLPQEKIDYNKISIVSSNDGRIEVKVDG